MKRKNQGEGSRTAARRYNERTQEFVENHDIDAQAREAEPESSGERAENRRAREKAASRARR